MKKNSVWSDKKLMKKYLPRIGNVNELNDAIQIVGINQKVGKEVSINGWVKSVRSSGKIAFIQFRDCCLLYTSPF